MQAQDDDKAIQRETIRSITRVISEENLEWLNRSIVAHSVTPKSPKAVQALNFIIKVVDIGNYKFILTFAQMEDLEACKEDELIFLAENFDVT